MKKILFGLITCIALPALMPSSISAGDEAEPFEALATDVLREQMRALTGDAQQAFRVDETLSSGLFGFSANATIAVPLIVLKEARTVGDVRAYLALRRVYRPDTAGRQRRLEDTSELLGYAGLAMIYSGLQSQESSRENSLSDLDNAPIDVAPFKPDSVAVSAALAAGGCEADAVAMLSRLSRYATNSGVPSGLIRVATDAREILRDLGMFAFHPAGACDRLDDPSFELMKQSLGI